MTDAKPTGDLPRLYRKRRLAAAILLLAAIGTLPPTAFAGSSTVQLSVSLTIIAGCGVTGRPLAPGGQSSAAGPTTQQVAVNVNCDHVVPYRVETDRAIVVDTGSNGVNVTVIY